MEQTQLEARMWDDLRQERNILAARYVLGWEVRMVNSKRYRKPYPKVAQYYDNGRLGLSSLPDFVWSMDDAMILVEELVKHGWHYRFEDKGKDLHRACFTHQTRKDISSVEAEDRKLATAITLAALRTVGIESPRHKSL